MSRFVKRLAPRQPLAVGDESFYGDPNATDHPYGDYEGVRWMDLAALAHVG